MHPLGVVVIAPDHPALPGHFPGRPIVPGVVVLDHAIALLLAAQPGQAVAALPAVRFTHPVRPNDRVHVAHAGDTLTCSVGGRTVATARIVLRPAAP